jgi:hypothetical protein
MRSGATKYAIYSSSYFRIGVSGEVTNMDNFIERYVFPGVMGYAIAMAITDMLGPSGGIVVLIALGVPWCIYWLFIWEDPIVKEMKADERIATLFAARRASDALRGDVDPSVD